MKILDFRYFKLDDEYELWGGWWSRIYEYPYIISKINELMGDSSLLIHNTAWGFEGVHVEFKNKLEVNHSVVNSDINKSKYPNTVVWDITHESPHEWVDKFDFVINVSTVEEVNYNHVSIIKNLLRQVKLGGYLIMTFDLPGLQLDEVEKFVGQSILSFDNNVNGSNSPIKNNRYSHMNCGLLIIQKTL